MIETGRETVEGGSPRPRPRKRAVRLTDDALAQLMNALYTRWEASGATGRLTREARAELLGVSVSTGDRIINRQGVDRHTLVLAFQSLNIPWSDSNCEYALRPEETPPEPISETREPAMQPAPRRSLRWLLWPAALICLIAIRPVYENVYEWRSKIFINDLGIAFHGKLDGATANFQAGQYSVAEGEIEEAVRIARRLESAEMIALARRIEADIASAQGSLSKAKDLYSQVLKIRESMNDERSLPAIYEALGDLETRTGDLKAAEAHLNEGLVGYRRERDPGGVAMCLRDLGSVALERDRWDEADRLLASALEVLAGKDPSMVKDIEARQALVLRERGRFGEARRILQACLDFWVKQNHPRWIAKTRWQLATVEAASGDHRRSRQLLVQAKEGYQRVGDRAGVADCDRALKELLPTHANSSSVSRTIGR